MERVHAWMNEGREGERKALRTLFCTLLSPVQPATMHTAVLHTPEPSAASYHAHSCPALLSPVHTLPLSVRGFKHAAGGRLRSVLPVKMTCSGRKTPAALAAATMVSCRLSSMARMWMALAPMRPYLGEHGGANAEFLAFMLQAAAARAGGAGTHEALSTQAAPARPFLPPPLTCACRLAPS